MKKLYCSGCNILVANIETGSTLKAGMVCLCENCETKRIASDLHDKTKPNYNVFNNIFNGFKK